MSVIDSLKDIIGDVTDDSTATQSTYRCSDCGHEFETAKNQESRISCPECLANDVRPVGTQ